MGNSFSPVSSIRQNNEQNPLKKRRSSSFIPNFFNNQSSNGERLLRRHVSLSRPRSLAPTDAEIVDVQQLRTDDDHRQLSQQLEYIYSCVRKDKGLFGEFNDKEAYVTGRIE